jgi:hypothetical protein
MCVCLFCSLKPLQQALQDIKHKTPGLTAIISFHRGSEMMMTMMHVLYLSLVFSRFFCFVCFLLLLYYICRLVAAAVLNPNPYFISRQQLKFVISTHVPWMPPDAVSRLVSAYDPFHAGFIRYVRLSAAVIAGNRPSMSSLVSSMNNGEAMT